MPVPRAGVKKRRSLARHKKKRLIQGCSGHQGTAGDEILCETATVTGRHVCLKGVCMTK